MRSIAYDIATLMLAGVRKKYKGNYSDIPSIKQYWHNCIYLFFSCANYRRIFPNEGICLEKMLKMQLVPQYLYVFSNNEDSYIKESLSQALCLLQESEIQLNTLRQGLLNLEMDFTGGNIALFSDKVSRDNTGSYYTPSSLAKAVVAKALSGKTIKENGDYRIADLSCGGGDFLLAVIDCFEEEYSIPAKETVRWLYGVDIDPIALQICEVSLLQRCGLNSWETVVSHFTFGNPLIINDIEVSEEDKNLMFSLGRLYSSELGINSDFFCRTYDIVVGNPPWEKVRFEERKFFRGIDNTIAALSQKSARDEAVEKLREENPAVYSLRMAVYSDYLQINSSSYRHKWITTSVTGELNTYALFTELAYRLLSERGVLALIVKSTLVTAPAHKKMWSEFLTDKAVKGVYLFENSQKIFEIDSRERFIVFVASKEESEGFEFSAGLTSPEMLYSAPSIALTASDLSRINPLTNTIPNVSRNSEIAFLRDTHRKFKLFSDVYSDCHFGRLIHLTAQSAFIDKQSSSSNVPIYEGKFIEQYDARYATYKGMPASKKYAGKAAATRIPNPVVGEYKELPECRFFVQKDLWVKYLAQYKEEYTLCWRSLTSPTNRRTMLAMILPTCPTCQSIQILQTNDYEKLLLLLALFNSIPFDYLVRIKMPGLDLTQSVIRQIPVPSEHDYQEIVDFNGVSADIKTHVLSYVRYLLRNENRLHELILKVEKKTYDVHPSNREEAKKMVDLLIKKAYHLSDSVYDEILLTFPKYQAIHSV